MCRDIDLNKLEGVVFDFGCNLHNFLINQEPRLFQFKRVLVDSFHFQNHRGCSSSYDASKYKKYLPEGFHTTGREQVNSRLSKIEDSFRQFNYSNYMNMLKIWFAIDKHNSIWLNMIKIE